MEWKKVENSRNQIKKAGKCLAKGNADIFEERNALDILDNWRAAHAYPLQVVASNLRRRTKGRDVLVVQRLKRLDSIVAKLKRQPWISLYDMQDLSGCRVIAPSVSEAYGVAKEYQTSNIKHKLHHIDDYIQKPKSSGYRGIHMVYRYHSNKNEDYEGMFVEIQFRSKLQHLWSTAVETMGLYTGTNLKAGEGDPEILRFFALVSSIFALDEKCPTIPNTPTNYEETIQELKAVCQANNILTKLSAIRAATQAIVREGNNATYYILTLNFQTKKVIIREYEEKELELATAAYKALESETDKSVNAVLVSAGSINDLKSAYPNYFTDIGQFVRKIGSLVER